MFQYGFITADSMTFR